MNSPKIAIVNHFDDITNQIDVECRTYLNSDGLTVELQEKAFQQQEEVILEVDRLQTQCLSFSLNIVKSGLTGVEDLEHSLQRPNLEDAQSRLLKLKWT